MEDPPSIELTTTRSPKGKHDVVGLRANRNVRGDNPQRNLHNNATGFRQIGRNPANEKNIVTLADDIVDGIQPRVRYSQVDIPRLREHWFEEYSDLLGPIPLELPPWQEVNHHIPLIDENLRYNYHLPQCPEALEEELRQKIDRYTAAGWWEMKAVYQASPLLCVPKKSGKLRTVVDARKRNDNTFKDVTPFPDQDQIRMDVARARYRT